MVWGVCSWGGSRWVLQEGGDVLGEVLDALRLRGERGETHDFNEREIMEICAPCPNSYFLLADIRRKKRRRDIPNTIINATL